MHTFTDEQLKAVALAIHQGVEFFVEDGRLWLGNRDDVFAAYEEWASEKGAEANFAAWLDEEGEEMPEYEDGGDGIHIVLTDDEADEAAAEYIKESLWAFNPSFLAGVTGVDQEVFEAIQANNRCENNNEAILRLVGDDLDFLIEQAIGADGRGHFLNTYDGHEHEINVYDVTGRSQYFYVYRV